MTKEILETYRLAFSEKYHIHLIMERYETEADAARMVGIKRVALIKEKAIFFPIGQITGKFDDLVRTTPLHRFFYERILKDKSIYKGARWYVSVNHDVASFIVRDGCSLYGLMMFSKDYERLVNLSHHTSNYLH